MKKFTKFLEEQNVILKGGSSPKKKAPPPKEEELGEVDTTPTETKTTSTKINEGRYNPETGKIDLVRGDMWHPTDEEYAEYLKNRDQERKPKVPGMTRDMSKPRPYINPQREPRMPRPGDRGMVRFDSNSTPVDLSKPRPYINPQKDTILPRHGNGDSIRPDRMPRFGDRGPVRPDDDLFNPERKPLFPGMQPNPGIKPGLKPVNPEYAKPTPKIPSDLFRPGKRPTGGLLPAPGTEPETKSASERFIDYYLHKDPSDRFRIGKRPKGEPNSFGIPTNTDRDDLFPGGRRPIPGGIPRPDNYFPTPGTKPESIIPQPIRQGKIDYLKQDFPMYYQGKSPKTDHKRPMDYLETQPMRYGSLPKLGDSNLIGKIPTEQEAYGGKLMSKMQQSQVDLEGNPTGLVKNIPIKPKIRK